MHIRSILIAILATCLLIVAAVPCQAQKKLHPMNQKLVQMGMMPVPKYYPEIPRITAEMAYSLYLSGKALFTLISYSDQHLIVGGIHLTENKPPSMDPNTLPFQPGQILVVY